MSADLTNVLAVPMHLDAFFANGASEAVAPMADFSLLPYVRHGHDHNASVPWLGEAIASRPFEGEHVLKPGIHLHWALPDALCRARGAGEDDAARNLVFPAVPDQWLVTRRWIVDGAEQTREWVVESTFLYPEDVSGPPAIAYPTPGDLNVGPGGKPFCYMGRRLSIEEWRRKTLKGSAADRYLSEPLTALGYGTPAFAAFYPNCHSVFGFHDPDILQLPEAGLSYEVLGWYRMADDDYLRHLQQKPQARLLPEVLKGLGWAAQEAPVADLPISLVCQARLTFLPSVAQHERGAPSISVTFGNTTAEALSAYLADEMLPDNKTAAANLEDQLEAVLLGSQLDHRQTDIAAKFKEARHAKGFTTMPPAFLWAIRPAAEGDSSDLPPPDWPDAAHLLDELNALQRDYNAARDEIAQMRRHVADDWHKYMQCAHPPEGLEDQYPDPDIVLHLINRRSLPELENLSVATGEVIRIPVAVPGMANDIAATAASLKGALAHRIVAKSCALHACLTSHAASGAARFSLQRVEAPRFFQPTEPVVLLTGSGVARSGHRYDRVAGKEGSTEGLACCWLTAPAAITDRIKVMSEALTARGQWEQHRWTGSPWHPLLMEWEVELRPFAKLANERGIGRRYHPDFVASNFTLKLDDVDLTPQSSTPLLAPRARPYRGASLLTPHGVDPYVESLTRALHRADAKERFSPAMTERLDSALKMLSDTHAVSQSLSGFNDALLMNKQVLQLPIDDPLGFPDERELAKRVRAAIGEGVHRSPQPDHDFSPIRAGELRLTKLRVVDTFGQIQDVDCATCRSASSMPLRPGKGAAVMLPARLAQPAQLRFRWISAQSHVRETNSHPDTSPICAWAVANHVDQSLFVYAADGEALGYLETEAKNVRWRSAPGRDTPIVHIDRDIEDRSLRQLLRFLLATSATYFVQFLDDLEAAQNLIEPEEAGDALLMGRPLALVRASIKLELQAAPAAHQGWHQFVADLQRGHRTRDAFTAVRFPVRLGEQGQLGDGLAVYFEEGADGMYEGYVIPSYCQAGDYGVHPADAKCDFLYVSAAAAPLNITMLLDPRGVVHATSGVLPVKAINIPTHQYKQAIQRIEMSFLAAPVLVDRTPDRCDIALPLAYESGDTWTFVEKRGTAQTVRAIRPATLHTPFNGPVSIREGWLRVSHNSSDQES